MHWSKPKVYGETPLHNKAHTAGSIGKNIYLFGGGDNSQYFNDLLVFDTETLTWSAPKTQGDRPSSRRALCSGVIGNTFYIFGGGDGQSPLNDLYSLNTDTLTWKKHVGKKGKFWPSPRGYHSGTVVGDKFYILGGSNITTCFNDAVIFDSKTESWSVRTPIEPKCRYAHSANLIGPYIFVFGGCDGFSYVETLDLLNLKTQTWENPSITGTPPPARGYHTATFHDNRLFIIGGNCGDTSFGDVYILDLGVYAYLPLQQTELVRESRSKGRYRAQSQSDQRS
eukprot:CAMPEP_0201504566 /NCGR_PEP_ID=MMETSP0151_2-20130828/85276_1 /ASSEMBLY_ACC=CAM_ASM_000257 /TAXON_ID=200890 /ORGANISM="Paramoeba atlantica, Strain 621/1 / CCAP 1560/9" /LENGTH=281 /DNA_ID=CAMNT_0047898317 /DNA_START=195 /DNA_END=1040 /DNA_ORIENTATION=+